MNTPAYMNWGRWVADCPAAGCSYAEDVTPGAASMVCAAGHVSTLTWPPARDVTAISAALEKRPETKNRNWLPAGHPWAEHGIPVDQTPDDLNAETAAGMKADAKRSLKREQLLALAAELGLSTDPAGNIHGKV